MDGRRVTMYRFYRGEELVLEVEREALKAAPDSIIKQALDLGATLWDKRSKEVWPWS